MNKATIKKALENCGFGILSEEKDAIEFGQYTPCGEDWYERLEWSSAIKFLADLQRRIECFDVDEEVEICYTHTVTDFRKRIENKGKS